MSKLLRFTLLRTTSAGPDNDARWKTLTEIFIILVPVSGGGQGVYALTTGLVSGSAELPLG